MLLEFKGSKRVWPGAGACLLGKNKLKIEAYNCAFRLILTINQLHFYF